MASIREVKGSPREQGVNERIPYTFAFSGGVVDTPVSATVTVYDITSTRTNVTATVMPTNNPTISGSDVTCSLLRDLTAGQVYRVQCLVTDADGVKEELYLDVKALN